MYIQGGTVAVRTIGLGTQNSEFGVCLSNAEHGRQVAGDLQATLDVDPNPNQILLLQHDIWFCDPHQILKSQLARRDFANEMDFAPKEVTDLNTYVRHYQNFMSGQWAWEQAVSWITLCSCNDLIK